MIQPFHIALLAYFKRGVHIHFKKAVRADNLRRVLPVCLKGGNDRYQDDEPGLVKESRDFSNATNIFCTVRFGKCQVPIQPQAQIVAVEPIGVESFGTQALLKSFRNG